jgi:ABC-type branched-subunit amino acid transport system ATPase component
MTVDENLLLGATHPSRGTALAEDMDASAHSSLRLPSGPHVKPALCREASKQMIAFRPALMSNHASSLDDRRSGLRPRSSVRSSPSSIVSGTGDGDSACGA